MGMLLRRAAAPRAGYTSSLAARPALASSSWAPSARPTASTAPQRALQLAEGALRARAGLYAAGALLAVGGMAYVWTTESEEGVVAHMCAVFEAGGARGWDARFSDDDATVARPAVVADIAAILRPGLKHEYAAIVGATATGKSTAARQALRALAAEPAAEANGVGVVYFSAPELVADFLRRLAPVVGYHAPIHFFGCVIRFFSGETKEQAVVPTSRDEPRATWSLLSEFLVKAALRYKARHGVAPTLVLDAMDLVAKDLDAGFFFVLQDFAKACADGALLRVVFVFSDGRALPMLQSSSASSRTERVYEVGDISDQDAVAYVRAHFGGIRDEAQAQELVHTIAGGRFNLLRILGSSAVPVASIRRELNSKTAADLREAGMCPSHPLFAAIAASTSLERHTALALMERARVDALLRLNIVAAHPDGTYTFHSRHVEAYIKSAAQRVELDARLRRWWRW